LIVIRVCISTVFATLRRLSKHNALQSLQKEPIHLFYGVVIKRTSRLLSLLDSLVFETIFVHFEICNRLLTIATFVYYDKQRPHGYFIFKRKHFAYTRTP